MVVSHPLGPGKFYGSSLPRPYIYTDVKNNSERVDPPVPLLDPLLSWAREAHWSMGGLSFTRLRLQGRIEGSVKRLRAQREKQIEGRTPTTTAEKSSAKELPQAPEAIKRKQFTVLIDDDEEKEEFSKKVGMVKCSERKRLARRLGDDFDRVADVITKGMDAAMGTRKRLRKVGEREAKQVVERVASPSPTNGIRVSPRLAKRG